VQGHVYLAGSKARVEQRGAQTEAYANSNSRRRHASERAHAQHHCRHINLAHIRTGARGKACCARWGVPAPFDFAAAAPAPRALSAKQRLADAMRRDATRCRYFDVEVFVTLHAPAEWPKFVAAEKAM
jgi:hypothetical protein